MNNSSFFIKKNENFIIDKAYSPESYKEFCEINFDSNLVESIEIKLSNFSSDEIYSLLEISSKKISYIKILQYFTQVDNMLAIHLYLHKYQAEIENFFMDDNKKVFVILFKNLKLKQFSNESYKDLQESYDETYYLEGCGGFDEFKKHQGKLVKDPRILSAYYLSDIKKSDVILDVGSGRGELSYLFSQVCEKMVGLDYSKDAVKVAKDTYGTSNTLEFVHGDILEYKSDFLFDKIVATDVVEHIEQEPLEKAFKNIHKLLKQDGMFIIHTSPNKLYYQKTYKKQRQQALSMGLYLPQNPRSCYEDLMHINEQTPATLKRSLKKSFKYVYVWSANLDNIKGNFAQKPSKKELSEHTSIFAIATDNNKIDEKYILSLMTQKSLKEDILDLVIKVDCNKLIKKVSENFSLNVLVKNNMNIPMKSFLPFPIYLCYHWKDKISGEYIIFDGKRAELLLPLMPNSLQEYYINIVAPDMEGEYILEITMVQENAFWFENRCENLPYIIETRIIE